MTLEQLKSADGEPFRQLFAIYAASIRPREQKPEDWLRAMVAAPTYRVWIAQDAGQPGEGRKRVLGFSILFVPPGEGFALLEYMAVAPEKRGHGFGVRDRVVVARRWLRPAAGAGNGMVTRKSVNG